MFVTLGGRRSNRRSRRSNRRSRRSNRRSRRRGGSPQGAPKKVRLSALESARIKLKQAEEKQETKEREAEAKKALRESVKAEKAAVKEQENMRKKANKEAQKAVKVAQKELNREYIKKVGDVESNVKQIKKQDEASCVNACRNKYRGKRSRAISY